MSSVSKSNGHVDGCGCNECDGNTGPAMQPSVVDELLREKDKRIKELEAHIEQVEQVAYNLFERISLSEQEQNVTATILRKFRQ